MLQIDNEGVMQMNTLIIIFISLIGVTIIVDFIGIFSVDETNTIILIVALGISTIILLAVCIAATLTSAQTEEPTSGGVKFPGIRMETGNYESGHIITEDGHIWDYDNPNSVFYDGEQVIVLFDVNGTEEIADDTILDVHSLEY